MQRAEALAFDGGGLDRAAQERGAAQTLRGQAETRTVAFWRGRPLVTGDKGALRLLRLPPEHPIFQSATEAEIFLGRSGTAPVFASDVSSWQPGSQVVGDIGPGRAAEDQPAPDLPDLPPDARFADLRGILTRLDAADGEIAATARGILEWHRSHRFCAACGAESHPADGGWRRDCPSCERPHFPRTDPVVIMLVTRGNNLLVGRSPGWPEGFYSLLAGFMEPGETVAAAVRREVDEEAGIKVGDVRMIKSQPWPFPASLMIGCAAHALDDDIRLDPVELEDAFWISREELLAAFTGQHPRMNAPRKGAIAQYLMKMWLADRID